MKYYKKTCVLRQLRSGFSGDGKPLSGLIKVEKYGQNLAVEVSVINFAPLSVGEYYCLIGDAYGRVEKLPLRGKCYFNLLSELNLEEGFCGVICFVHDQIHPVACGVNGDKQYAFPRMLAAAFPKEKRTNKPVPIPVKEEKEPPMDELTETPSQSPALSPESATTCAYDDERMANENYFEKEAHYEPDMSKKSSQNAPIAAGGQDQETKTRLDLSQNDDDEDVRHPFTTDGHGYYDAVQSEIDGLFASYPRDDTLNKIFAASEWVRLKGEADDPQYLVGVVYEDLAPKYICYAVVAKEGSTPPAELGEACIFVPVSAFEEDKGFFVIFQSAATGECIRPKSC